MSSSVINSHPSPPSPPHHVVPTTTTPSSLLLSHCAHRLFLVAVISWWHSPCVLHCHRGDGGGHPGGWRPCPCSHCRHPHPCPCHCRHCHPCPHRCCPCCCCPCCCCPCCCCPCCCCLCCCCPCCCHPCCCCPCPHRHCPRPRRPHHHVNAGQGVVIVCWGLGSSSLSSPYAEDGCRCRCAAMEALSLSLSGGCGGGGGGPACDAGAIVTGLVVASSTQVGGAVAASLMLRVLQVVVVSGELTGWYYLPCGSWRPRMALKEN